MKVLNLRFKEVKPKNIRKELVDGLRYLQTDDCRFSVITEWHHDKQEYVVCDDKVWDYKQKDGKGRWTFDNANDAVKKFKQLCRIK